MPIKEVEEQNTIIGLVEMFSINPFQHTTEWELVVKNRLKWDLRLPKNKNSHASVTDSILSDSLGR